MIVTQPPIYVGSAAVYPYSDSLLEQSQKMTIYGDGYSLARVIGVGEHRRIWLPRNLASSITEDKRVRGNYVEFESSFIPRNSEQTRVIKETTELLKLGENFLLQAPTGFGKTYCAMDIIANVAKKTIVVVTKEDIRDQWIAAAEKVLGLKVGQGIGLIQGDTCLTQGQSIVIAMIQSLSKEGRYPEYAFKDFGLAIWDETHRVAADVFSQSCYRIPAKLRLGISATPKRKDGKGTVLDAHIGKVRVVTHRAPMTPKVISRKSPWECPQRKVKLDNGTWVMKQIEHSAGKCGHIISMIARHHPRNEMLANFIKSAYTKGRKILAQSDRLEHIELIGAMLGKLGIPSTDISYYVGGLTENQRTVAKTKRVILSTYSMTAEATDIPDADTLVMLTPKSDVEQIVGRVIREHPDKKQPIVFDLTDPTSSVFMGYGKARQKFYERVGAEIDFIK